MEPIAIIGIGCRYPGAKDPEAFWQLLRNGVDAIAQVPKDRWDIDQYYDPEPGKPSKMSTRWGGFIEQVDQFEPSFFGISPREVERMDPQQRLALEVAWEALENAGIAPETLAGSQAGVFMGIGNYDYCRLLAKDISLVNAYDGTGNTLSIAANRLSYILNLRGPSVVVETACSSSLVALHFACRSLQTKESNLCLVGGVSLMLSPEPFITYSHARMMASDGRCKTFDASADGYVRGEGCGVVILKRLSDALRDEDNILAVIKGSAVNQDGLSNGLTAPNGPSQQAVIRQALENAGVTPEQISYVEAHGTGTSLGDPIEFRSLKAVLMKERKPDQPCWLGSVKTNIGHLEAASGIAGLIKVVLSLSHQEIPPHLHLKQLNPLISLEGTTFSIPNECQPWAAERRLAGISAFGFGGTNCHVIVEEAPAQAVEKTGGEENTSSAMSQSPTSGDNPKSKILNPKFLDRPLHLLTLSAKSEKALEELAQRYAYFLESHPEVSLADVCFTANTGRSHFDYRLAVVAESSQQLQEALSAFAAGKKTPGLVSGQLTKKRPKIAFLFTGQGSQYVEMGRQLYKTQPIFRQALDHCDRILRSYLKHSLLDLLYPEDGQPQQIAPTELGIGNTKPKSNLLTPTLDETAYTQPALFALEYALFQLWKSWGIEPTVVMGHSVGEYAAACVAGVFSLEDGLKLIAERARLMQALPENGDMVAVFASPSQVQAVIQPYETDVSIAAINGPESVVISGKRKAVEAAIATLKAQGIKAKKLTVSHAFHSPAMEPMLSTFERATSKVEYSSPQIKLISNVTGEFATTEVMNPKYWCRHVRLPVKFAQGMQTLHQQGYDLFVEIGPKPILLGMGRHCLPDVGMNGSSALHWLPSLSPSQDDWQQLLQTLGALYVRGVAVDWSSFDRDYPRRRLQLPSYPFQRQRYWVEFSDSCKHEEAKNGHQKTASLSLNNAQTPIANLLLNGDTKQLIQQLGTAEKLSDDELKLLPKLLDLLVKSNQEKPTEASSKNWFYQVEWQTQPRQLTTTQNGSHQPGSWLIFADIGGIGQTLAQLLRDRGHHCILVYPGDSYHTQDTGTWRINPSNWADCDRLFQDALATSDKPLQGVIHLWSLEAHLGDELTLSSLEQAQVLGVASVLHLLQALCKHSKSASPRLWLVSRNAVPVGASPPAVAQAPLWGLGRVIALEHPELWGGMLDLAPEPTEDEATKLLAEIGDSQGEDHLAFRDGKRYVARLVHQQPPESQTLTLQSDATYLITGGLGALGLKVAQWMIERGARNLVLTSRRRASTQAQETISQLELSGAKVLTIQADVANSGDVSKMLEAIEALMPPLQGIIHAAGVLDDGILLQQDWERFTRVMNPKVKGAWNLHALTQTLPLDFFVVFSSAASLLGSPGQGNYATANAFMDALVHYRRSLGLPGLSINWGPWANSGMAATLNSRNQARLAAQGVSTIAPEQGLQVLEQLLHPTPVQVGVLPFEWSVFTQQLSSGRQLPLFSQLMREASPQAETKQASTQQPELLQQLNDAPAHERQKLLITYLQAKVAKVMGLSTSTLNTERSLHDLGLDSLMAVELTSLLRAELQVELPIRALIEDPTIDSIATLLINQLMPESSNAETQVEVAANVLDLNAEAVLDPAISPDNAHIAAVAEPTSIFLTGATGFLGAFLLQELLDQTQAEIYCLVRSPDVESAKTRLHNNLQSYDLWHEDYRARIIPVLGDLAQPQLGLSTEQFEQLAHQIDAIYHNGALLNYVYPYSKFKPINVLGTQEVLRLACQTKVKPVHHISSVAVFESSAYYGKQVTESDDIDRSEGIFLG
ncbi:MAG TPA: SDR family NAD(P)-dependent oxidoreductase, partial [Coleofasciculaceae cyanobacterium]